MHKIYTRKIVFLAKIKIEVNIVHVQHYLLYEYSVAKGHRIIYLPYGESTIDKNMCRKCF